MSYVLGTYERSVKENFISGKGSYLYNDKNVKYLDFVQGIAVNALGHNHQALVKAMKSNSEKPWHLSNLFLINIDNLELILIYYTLYILNLISN